MPGFYPLSFWLRHALVVVFVLWGGHGAWAQEVPEGQGQVADRTELRVLRELYEATAGQEEWGVNEGWVNASTLTEESTLAEVEDWFGVVQRDGDIVSLSLPKNGLRGKLPAGLSELTALEYLDLTGNKLSGPLPDVAHWPGLKELQLRGNKFTGFLPAALGRLHNLGLLDVGSNQLTGSVPDSLGECTSLAIVNLGGNGFSGPLPATMGQLVNLQQFYASHNAFDGPLPANFASLRQLWILELAHNRFTGPIPAAWGGMTSLSQLFLGSNRLEGSLPDNLAQLRDLAYFVANDNRLTGPIPAAYKGFRHLVQFNLANNALSGPLPDSLHADFVFLSHNHLSGALPPSYATTQTRQLQLADNDLTSLPTFAQPLGYPNLQLGLANNLLAFDSFERNQAVPGQYQYWDSQRPPSPADTLQRPAGTAAPLDGRIAGAHNRYQWQRQVGGQWVDLPGDTLAWRTWPAVVPADAGLYRTRVTNTWVVGVTLYSRPHYLDVVPYPAPPRNRPDDTNQVLALAVTAVPTDAATRRNLDVNFVRTWVPRVALTDSLLVPRSGEADVAVATEYLDGLGRPVQTVQHRASPQHRDLVQPVAYDALGRSPKQYLPYSADPADTSRTTAQGYHHRALTDQRAFYNRTTPPGGGLGPLAANDPIRGVARTGVAFAESVFEASPLNRVVAQGAAGETWQVGNGHVMERTERPNTAADSVLRFVFGFNPSVAEPGNQSFYAPGELWGTDVADVHGPNEPGAKGYRTIEWKDKQGQLVCRQVEAGRRRVNTVSVLGGGDEVPENSDVPLLRRWLRTAYAYDDFGRLRYVVQPEGVKVLLRAAAGLQLWLPLDEPTGTQAVDLSGAGRTGTMSGSGTWLPTGGHDGGGALALTGSQHLDVPLAWQPTRFTVSFWIKPTFMYTGSQQMGALAGWGAFSFHSSGYGWAYVGTDQATALKVLTDNTVEYNVWQQFVFTFDNGVGALYKNGQLLAQRAGMAPCQPWQGLRLGITNEEVYDEVRVYNRALTGPEVAAAFDGTSVAAFTFHYRYDGRGRQIAKQVPGTDGETVVVFDQLDRPVLSQDAAQRTRREWSFTKYDALGRVVLSGLVKYRNPVSRDELQTLADLASDASPPYELRTSDANYPHHYTTDRAFPRLGEGWFDNGQVLSATYYDDYNFDNDAAGTADASYDTRTDGQFPAGTAPVADALRTTGLTTRTRTRVLGVDPGDLDQAAWLTTTTFYDERARPVQVQTTNARKNRLDNTSFTDLLTTRLDFTGKVVQSVAVHQGPKHDPVMVTELFTYDHTGRLLTTHQQLPGEALPTQIASVAYNEIGQAIQKTMGTGRLAQQVDYAYNIRGWLTQLNNPYYPKADDLFNLSLHYNEGFTAGYEQYNGNLTGQTWRSSRDGVQRAYGYVYDPLNRLLQGDFVAHSPELAEATGGTGWRAEEDNYRLSFASYDDNGNLLTLRRRGLLANATHATAKQYGPVDHLTYAYAGNRLQAVDDAVNTNQLPRPLNYNGAPTSLAGDFQEGGSRQGREYFYDANGNLTQDRNKGITGIAYNHLNLPKQIHFGIRGDSIVFRYTAAGQKVAKLVYQTGKPMLRTDYLGPYQYEQDSLRFFPHAEGRVLRFANTTSGAVRYQREFTFKDHLGNLRLAYRLGQVRTLTATLEQDATTHGRESQQFDSLSVSPPVAVPTGLARTGAYAARLNAGGSAPRPLGPLTQFAVQKGDTVRATAFGLYPQATSSNSFAFSLAGFIASLLQPAPTAPAGVDGSRRGGLPLLQVGLSSATLLALNQLPGGVPQGYLRVLSFNEDSVLVDQRTVQLRATALGNYDMLQTGPLVVQQNGYVSVYVGNESAADVYFDDVSIEHRPGLQVQENQYDPFGLDLAGVSGAAPGLRLKNFYQFNGKENQLDLGLNWNHHDARFYDYQVARWHGLDPMIEDGQENWTPYAFSYNNAVRFSDPDGQFPILLATGAAGAAIGAVIGAGVEAGTQMYNNGGHVKDWHAVGGAALQGGVTGGVAGLTGGTSLLRSGAVGAVSNVAGGVARNLHDGKPVTVGSVANDAAVGAVTGVAGYAAGKAIGAVANRLKGGAAQAEAGAARGAAKVPCGCFTAGTGVSTRLGRRPIEQIQVGDSVWAYNERTRQTALRPVTHLFRYERDTVYVLHTATGAALRTTSDHPFYVRGQWVRVKRLRVGDSLVSQSGQRHMLRRIDRQPEHVTVYNFTVDELHTYFVGQNAILVHNTSCPPVGGSTPQPKSTRFVAEADGTVHDVKPTMDRISSGGRNPHRNDGSVFKNKGGDLPTQPQGHYREYVHPTPGTNAPGAMRVVTGQDGKAWFSSDHYKTFTPIR